MRFKWFMILFVFLAGMLSCQKATTVPVEPKEDESLVSVRFQVADDENYVDTKRSGNPSSSNESSKDRVTYLLFNSSNALLKSGSMTGSEFNTNGITVSLAKSTQYRIQIYINPETSFNPSSYTSPTGTNSINNVSFTLGSTTYAKLPMVGDKTFTTTNSDSQTVTVNMTRLVSRVRVGTINMNLTSGQLNGRTFTLKKIYLTNALYSGMVGTDSNGKDQQTLTSSQNTAYNPMGNAGRYVSSNNYSTITAYENLLVQSVNSTMTTGSSNSTGYYFYTIPNPCTAANDSRSTTWSVRCTRLVIETQLGSDLMYYVITIPAMARNNSYNYENININGLGSTSPEQDSPKALTFTFSVSQDSWDNTYNVSETI